MENFSCNGNYIIYQKRICVYFHIQCASLLCNWTTFISAFLSMDDVEKVIKDADRVDLEREQANHGGRRLSDKCSHTQTSECVSEKKSTLTLVCSST